MAQTIAIGWPQEHRYSWTTLGKIWLYSQIYPTSRNYWTNNSHWLGWWLGWPSKKASSSSKVFTNNSFSFTLLQTGPKVPTKSRDNSFQSPTILYQWRLFPRFTWCPQSLMRWVSSAPIDHLHWWNGDTTAKGVQLKSCRTRWHSQKGQPCRGNPELAIRESYCPQ